MTTTPTSGAADLPEALTADQWLDLAIRHANKDWNSAQPDGYANAVKALCADFSALTAQAPSQPGFDAGDMASAAAQGFRDGWTAAQAISAEPAGATEMENLQRTAVGWQERALRAERNWVVCRRWAIAGGAPVEKLGDDPDQPFHAASPAIEGESAPAVGYPPLPNLDGSNEQIWEAIFNWKTATSGADAVRKANKVENAIIGTMRACVDADRAARAPADSVQEDAAREAIEKVLALFPFNALIQKFSVNNGPCLTADNDDEFYSVKRVLAFLTEIKTTLDAARKQGATQ